MDVIVVSDYDEMSRRAAELVARRIAERPNLRIGLPTGNTPVGMYEELVRMYEAGAVDFSELHTFNLDEYWGIEPDHPAAFARYIDDRFLAHVNVPQDQAHRPSGVGDAQENAAAYESVVGAGGLDVVLLGIGVNAHIGFNEPGASFGSRTELVALAEQTRVDAFHPKSGFHAPEDVPTHGITMGMATILEAGQIVLLASGAAKAEAIRSAVEGPVTEQVPASALQRHDDVTFIVDEAAAAVLTKR